VAALLVGAALTPLAAAGKKLPAGCDGRTTAVHGGAARSMLACATSTGYATAESHVNVMPNGTVIFTPAVLPQKTLGIGQLPGDALVAQSNASPGALAVSPDGGVHWKLVMPSGTTWNPTDHGDYVDPVTGRWFFESYGPIPLNAPFGPDQEGPSHLNVSGDKGRTWAHSVIRDTQITENAQFTANAVPPGGDRTVGYPRVTYYCANISIGFTNPLITQRSCYRSLNGKDFAMRSVILRSNVPVHPECLQQGGENLSAMDGHYPQPGPKGSLYLMLSCGQKTFLARSSDEALTFPVLTNGETPREVPVPPAAIPDFNSSALQVLDDGTLVVVYQDGNRLKLKASGDEGRHWTNAFDVTAPGVSGVTTWTVASRGHALALAYLAEKGGAYYPWVAKVPDPRTLLRSKATAVLSGQVQKGPALYGKGLVGPAPTGAGTIPGPGGTHLPFPPPFTIQLFGNDFIGAAIGPDGTAYGSFTQDCGPTPDSPGCLKNGGQTRGLLGRLVAR
jgi:hypothetical protein